MILDSKLFMSSKGGIELVQVESSSSHRWRGKTHLQVCLFHNLKEYYIPSWGSSPSLYILESDMNSSRGWEALFRCGTIHNCTIFHFQKPNTRLFYWTTSLRDVTAHADLVNFFLEIKRPAIRYIRRQQQLFSFCQTLVLLSA